MKAKITIEGKIPIPEIGEQYCDWGIGGRSGFYCSNIKKITKTHIILSAGNPNVNLDNPLPDVIDKISIEEYARHYLLDGYNPNKKMTIKVFK